ncbi:MAG: hypothetical protein HC837_10285 [Chloroflexaceae bacterium]|nr:hypothetical protein [Chloroflexaceae bacterium]
MDSTAIYASTALRPASLVALEAYPLLWDTVAADMNRQAARISALTALFIGRRSPLAQLNALLNVKQDGLISVEGSPGSGVTTLLAHVVATRRCAFWLGENDAGDGMRSLCAQLIALHQLSVPLVPLRVSQATTLEHLLEDAASHRDDADPLLLVVDPPAVTLQPLDPLPLALPAALPSGVVLISGCQPGAPLPFAPTARIVLPQAGSEVRQDQMLVLQAMECPDQWIDPLIDASHGNFWYLRLAVQLLELGLIDVSLLPPGLETLHNVLWQSLDAPQQQFALLLAAAGEPIPLDCCREVLGSDPQSLPLCPIFCWREHDALGLYHWFLRDYLAHHQPAALAQMHSDMVDLALRMGIDKAPAPLTPGPSLTRGEGRHGGCTPTLAYMMRQFARHAAFAPRLTRERVLPMVAERTWLRNQERRSALYHVAIDLARDLAWELRGVTELIDPVAHGGSTLEAMADPALLWKFSTMTDAAQPDQRALPNQVLLLRLVCSAVLAGSHVSLSVTMEPEAAVYALDTAQHHMSREIALKRVMALVDQLPNTDRKARVLRQLGEACFGLGMRLSAMRLLSQALDVEDYRVPSTWQEQRETLLMALTTAALSLEAVAAAQTIAQRIGHTPRRGMAQKQIVDWLLQRGELGKAQAVQTIEDESLSAWTQAEVAVAMARAGEWPQAETILQQIAMETARSWATIELACDAAPHDEAAAFQRIAQLATQHQRDTGLKRLAEALAHAAKDGDALAAAGQIQDVAVRVSALLNLRLKLDGLVAMLALEQVNAEIDRLEHDIRVPLVTMLASAYAALNRSEQAIQVANRLPEGEERDRALSRVAVTFVQHGQVAHGLLLARSLTDDDERDWTLNDIARSCGAAGDWDAAHTLAEEIRGDRQRSQTLADLAIARARAGDVLAAYEQACTIPVPGERTRALLLMAPHLVQAGSTDTIQSRAASILPLPSVSRFRAAIATALAQQGHLARACAIIPTISQRFDQGRAWLAIAHATASHDQRYARAALGRGLQAAVIGRAEAFRLIEQAVPTLAVLGDASLLVDIAAALDDIDTW